MSPTSPKSTTSRVPPSSTSTGGRRVARTRAASTPETPTAGRRTARQAASTAVFTVPLSVMTTVSSACGGVTRRPPTNRVSIPRRPASAVDCGPLPCTSTTLMPTSRRTLTCSASRRRTAASVLAAPPSLITNTRPLYSLMYGSARVSPAIAARGRRDRSCALLGQHLEQQRLLGVQAVAGLADDDAPRPVEHLVRHLHVAPHRQAVHEAGARPRRPVPRLRDAPVAQASAQRGLVGGPAVERRRRPRLGVDDVRAHHCGLAVGGLFDAAAAARRPGAGARHDRLRQRVALGSENCHLHPPPRRHRQGGRRHRVRQRPRVVGPRQHETTALPRDLQVVQCLPVGQHLARVRNRRLQVDERYRRERGHRADHAVGEVLFEVLPAREATHGECVGVLGEHRDRVAHVLGGVAVHHDAVAGLELPGALARRDHERGTPELGDAGLHRGQRPQRRVHEQERHDAAAQRVGKRSAFQLAGAREHRFEAVVGEIVEVEEALHGCISFSAATSSSTCASSRISGGSRRTTWGSALPPARIPFPRRRASTSLAGETVRRPSRNPIPCTAVTGPTRHSLRSRADSRRTRASRPSASIVAITASASAIASGPPPNVVPRSPFLIPAASASPTSTAPTGKPPPSPFAVVSTSGRMPCACAANGCPVRPIPHCTSSKMRMAPAAAVAVRAVSRKARESARAPATPWTGSRITAATSLVTARSRAAASSNGTHVTTNGSTGNPYQRSWPAVTAPEAAMRPWNAPSTATTRGRPVARNAMRRAFSFASAPELTKNARGSPGGPKRTRLAAARSRTSRGTMLDWKNSVRAWRSSAATSAGCPYPRRATACPP